MQHRGIMEASLSDAEGQTFREIVQWCASRCSLLAQVFVLCDLASMKKMGFQHSSQSMLRSIASRPHRWTKTELTTKLYSIVSQSSVFVSLLNSDVAERLKAAVNSSTSLWFTKYPSQVARDTVSAKLDGLSTKEFVLAFLSLYSCRGKILVQLAAQCESLKAFKGVFARWSQLESTAQPALSVLVYDLASQALKRDITAQLKTSFKSLYDDLQPDGHLPQWLGQATNITQISRQTKPFQVVSWIVLEFFSPSTQKRIFELMHDKTQLEQLHKRFCTSPTAHELVSPAFGRAAESIHIEDLCIWELFVDTFAGAHDIVAADVSIETTDSSGSVVSGLVERVRKRASADCYGGFSIVDVYCLSSAELARLTAKSPLTGASDLKQFPQTQFSIPLLEFSYHCGLAYLQSKQEYADVDFELLCADLSGFTSVADELSFGDDKQAAWMALGQVGKDMTDLSSAPTFVFDLSLVRVLHSSGKQVAFAAVTPDRVIHCLPQGGAQWRQALQFLGAVPLALDESTAFDLQVLTVAFQCFMPDAAKPLPQDCMQHQGGQAYTAAAADTAVPKTTLAQPSGPISVGHDQIKSESELIESSYSMQMGPESGAGAGPAGGLLSARHAVSPPPKSTSTTSADTLKGWIKDLQSFMDSTQFFSLGWGLPSAGVFATLSTVMDKNPWLSMLPSQCSEMQEVCRIIGGTPLCICTTKAAFDARGTLGLLEPGCALGNVTSEGYIIGHTVAHVAKGLIDKDAFSDQLKLISERIPSVASLSVSGAEYVPVQRGICGHKSVLAAVVHHSGSDYCLLDASGLHVKWSVPSSTASGTPCDFSEVCTAYGGQKKIFLGCIHGLSDILDLKAAHGHAPFQDVQATLTCSLKGAGITDESARFGFRCSPVLLSLRSRTEVFTGEVYVVKMGVRTGITIGKVRTFTQIYPGFDKETVWFESFSDSFSQLSSSCLVVKAVSMADFLGATISGLSHEDKARLFLQSNNCKQAVEASKKTEPSKQEQVFRDFVGVFALQGDSGAAVAALEINGLPCVCGSDVCILSAMDYKLVAMHSRKIFGTHTDGFMDLTPQGETRVGLTLMHSIYFRRAEAALQEADSQLDTDKRSHPLLRPKLPVLGFVARTQSDSPGSQTFCTPADASLLNSAGTRLLTRKQMPATSEQAKK